MCNKENYIDTDKLLNEALKTEPGFMLSENFADVMAKKMERKFAWDMYLKEFLIYLGAIVGLMAVPVGIQLIFFTTELKLWTVIITENYPVIGGIFFLVIFILFADRVLLRYFLHGSVDETNPYY